MQQDQFLLQQTLTKKNTASSKDCILQSSIETLIPETTHSWPPVLSLVIEVVPTSSRPFDRLGIKQPRKSDKNLAQCYLILSRYLDPSLHSQASG